jgi:FlaA1/EpsC-like NDP-sugar epimerase
MRNLIITYRRAFVVGIHLALWTMALVLAVVLRFEFDVPRRYGTILPQLLALSLLVRTIIHWRAGLFHGLWRYSGSRDLRSLIAAATLSSASYASVWAFMQPDTFPRSIFVLDWAFSILIVGGLRFGIRTLREVTLQNAAPASDRPRPKLLVIGAGDAGEMLMREIVRTHRQRYEPVGFLDDNATKHGEQIHGVPVLGPLSRVTDITKTHHIGEIIIAIPSLSGREMRRVVDLCAPTGARIKTLPGMDKLIDGSVTVSQLSEVNIDDLLRRDPVVLDTAEIGEFLRGRTVMVTGAGGSIGSELCRQILRFKPRRLVLVEQAENSLFQIDRVLRADLEDVRIGAGSGVAVVPLIADICDSKRIDAIFASERPNVVFHAAAHKHVPLMESNFGEAIKNNVFGTRKLADAAVRYGVEKFVMVSTDKAVNPTSIMGVSKRVAEIYVQSLSNTARTQFVTVRFGNVLGSAGSVVPVFREQIAAGGPVKVTHPEMKRYFMTIPEACQLVMQAGSMGRGGEIFVLDMGEPVKIVDLARDLIRLSGLDPDRDIEIQFTGMRPGEKLFEEIAVDEENAAKTKHPQIYVGKFRPHEMQRVERALVELHRIAESGDRAALVRSLQHLVPEYQAPDDLPMDSDAPAASSEGAPDRDRLTPDIALVN